MMKMFDDVCLVKMMWALDVEQDSCMVEMLNEAQDEVNPEVAFVKMNTSVGETVFSVYDLKLYKETNMQKD